MRFLGSYAACILAPFTLSAALPIDALKSRQTPFLVPVTFFGASPSQFFEMNIPTNDQKVVISKPLTFAPYYAPLPSPPLPPIFSPQTSARAKSCFSLLLWSFFFFFLTRADAYAANPLSVSSISVGFGGECSFFGSDGADVFVPDGKTGYLGPPQRVVGAVCDEI